MLRNFFWRASSSPRAPHTLVNLRGKYPPSPLWNLWIYVPRPKKETRVKKMRAAIIKLFFYWLSESVLSHGEQKRNQHLRAVEFTAPLFFIVTVFKLTKKPWFFYLPWLSSGSEAPQRKKRGLTWSHFFGWRGFTGLIFFSKSSTKAIQ